MSSKMKTKPWTAAHKTKYEWLYNYMFKNYDNIDKLTFIEDNKRQLMGIIDKNTNWSDSSKEGLYFMISRYLFNKKNNDRYIKLYSQKGFELMQKTKATEELNILDDKEKLYFRDRDFFINILNNKEAFPNSLNGHYEYLLLSLLVLQPPLRTSFYNSASLLKTLDVNNKKDNYIYLNRRGKIHAYFIVNKDKASNYKLYNMDKTLNKIEIENQTLCNLINDSFKTYPRTFLFELKNKAISTATILKMLRNISGVEGLTVDIMRSSYITWFYKHNKQYGQRDELSRHMRHSQATASKNYLKIFEDDEEQPRGTVQEKPNNNNTVIFKLTEQIKELENKIKTCSKDEDETLLKKRRADIIYRINKKGVIPKASTLEKYNIVLNTRSQHYQ